MLPSPGRSKRRTRRRNSFQTLVPSLISLLLLFSPGNAQFGEIASVITSLLASGGGGAGLAGLAGSGASLGSLGAASAGAGTGAAGAVSNIGTCWLLMIKRQFTIFSVSIGPSSTPVDWHRCWHCQPGIGKVCSLWHVELVFVVPGSRLLLRMRPE